MSKGKKKNPAEQVEETVTETVTEEAAETAEAEVEVVTDTRDEEIAKLKDQLMRNMAEYDNYRKRTAKEKTELMPDLTVRIVSEFLPVLDNLERALATDCTDENYKKGVEMIYESFMGTLDKLGVEKVPTEDFDPSIHQAVQQVESDTLESGKIATVFQNGYRLGNKVLRFAMVTVVA